MPGQVAPSPTRRPCCSPNVAQQRDGLRMAAFGLTDAQARLTPTKGALSIGGLLKHVAECERSWIDTVLGRERPREAAEAADEDGFRLRAGETLAGALAALDAAADETEAVVADLPLDHPVPVPQGVPWFPQDVDAWSLRWVLLHLVEEIARHAGHADIVRESIDGATMHELMAGYEGWPATEWLTPWQP